MLRNILAAIGLYFVGKKGFEHYQKYDYYKRRAEEKDQASDKGNKAGRAR